MSHDAKLSKELEVAHIEGSQLEKTILEDSELIVVSPEEAKKILWKIDRRLLSVVGLVYCISLLDRGNFALANSAGMKKDLELSVGNRYSLIALIFFVPYIIFEFPSTILIRIVGPRLFISGICMTWGILMIGSGFVNNWHELFGIRILLRAGFFPGSVYLLSTWYSRYDVHKRFSFFYLIGSMSSALGGILSYAFSRMDGVAGIAGWRWIFIMEGIITCLIATLGVLLIVEFPEKAAQSWNFLSEREASWVVQQINNDRNDVTPEKFNLGRYCREALDVRLWLFGLLFFCVLTTPYAVAFFLPAILGSMGFNTAESQYLTAPPYFAAAFLMLGTAWFGDKYKVRGPGIIACSILTIIGLVLIGFTKTTGVRYFGVFLTVSGANSNIPAIMAYQANNIVGQTRRAMGSALLVGMGGVGGIAGSLVFRSQDYPLYRPGIYACLA
ncbi:hypothetical protein V502_10206 [Pseudogymnoascus sp. VKM F-4520 (FW-2644)]|nr:hypothetical protein V502_10206 [Pseudogymnoascus sp. VKM F-4520 (FW-2644)]